jgi:hypothetical protein
MARITVFISDDVLFQAESHYVRTRCGVGIGVNRSHMVTEALKVWAAEPARPEASQRGRIETLRTLRAAREALDELEQGLTQGRPVKRRVRRYAATARRHRDT